MGISMKNGISYSSDNIPSSTLYKQIYYESNYILPEIPGPEIECEDFLFNKNIKSKILLFISIIIGLPISFIVFINLLELCLFLLINLA